MAKCSYSKRNLTVACSNVKRDLVSKLKKGTIKNITKTLAINEIAKRLGLKSSRTLWKPEYSYRKYLDDWYSNVEKQIVSLNLSPKEKSTISRNASDSENESSSRVDTSSSSSSISQLNTTINELNTTISELKGIIRTLRIENESLRIAKLHRLSRLDNTEILDESIDDLELEKLYKVITSLYKSINQ